MSIVIDDPDVASKVNELADRKGLSAQRAVEVAVTMALAQSAQLESSQSELWNGWEGTRLHGDELDRAVRAIQDRVQSMRRADPPFTVDDLYGENGLPA